jgi:hypothetical protein
MRRIVGPRCTICNHPARPQIDLAIATGVAKRAIAARFQVSRDAVWRHAQAHLTAEILNGACAAYRFRRLGALVEGSAPASAFRFRPPVTGSSKAGWREQH